MTTPLQLYEAALRRGCDGRPAPLSLVAGCGATRAVDVARWCADAADGDAGLVARCVGPTLDLGCGPGRLAVAVSARGVPALGVDISPAAVRLARHRGAQALRRDLFQPLPGERRWAHVLLADGNIGIGGDPVRLLGRCRSLIADDGTVLVETEPPRAAVPEPEDGRSSPGPVPAPRGHDSLDPDGGRVQLRLRDARGSSVAFDWAFVAADVLADHAARAGLRVIESWREAGRWFSQLGIR